MPEVTVVVLVVVALIKLRAFFIAMSEAMASSNPMTGGRASMVIISKNVRSNFLGCVVNEASAATAAQH
eukprot:1145843-Pelagomonas_calceolata.AAC.10